MTRQDALDAHRRQGLPTLAVLPIHYPRELLDALDILGIELWGPPGPLPDGPSERIQAYVCSLVRNAMAFIDAGGIDGVDGILFPNTCDSMMGLASLVPDLVGYDKPVFHLHLPRVPEAHTAEQFLETELRRLWTALAEAFDREPDLDRLAGALETRRAIELAHRELRAGRRRLPMPERELMALLRQDGYLPAAEHLRDLQRALRQVRKVKQFHAGPGVVLSGIVPEPMALLDTLEDAGAVVVGDDYGSTGRRLPRYDRAGDDDPLRQVARRMAARPPCSTTSADTHARTDYLAGLVRRSGAAGLIVHSVRFCEPELFDIPAIKDRMERDGVPVLFLDTEVEREVPGALQTRVEAFVEMLS